MPIYYFCRECSRLASDKGYRGWLFKLLACVLWYGFNIIGTLVAVADHQNLVNVLLSSLLGTGLGAFITWMIIVILPDRLTPERLNSLLPKALPTQPVHTFSYADKSTVWCIGCGEQLAPDSKICDKCGASVPSLE